MHNAIILDGQNCQALSMRFVDRAPDALTLRRRLALACDNADGTSEEKLPK